MSTKKGIDISYAQGEVDFSKLKGHVDFVIMQIGYGKYATQVDKQFQRNYLQCKKYGIDCGGYWFSYAQTAEEAKEEAQACYTHVKDKKFEYPIYFDIEGKSLIGKTAVSDMCEAFCHTLEKAGCCAGIYISRSYAQTMLEKSVADKYALWIAEYGGKCNYSGKYGMWQYTSTAKCPGISTNTDCDLCYEDYPQIIRSEGLNGYEKSDSKALDETGYSKGDKTLGVYALKQLLMLAYNLKITPYKLDDNSIFGSGTTKSVNYLLDKWGYKPTGIAGKKFIAKLYDHLR